MAPTSVSIREVLAPLEEAGVGDAVFLTQVPGVTALGDVTASFASFSESVDSTTLSLQVLLLTDHEFVTIEVQHPSSGVEVEIEHRLVHHIAGITEHWRAKTLNAAPEMFELRIDFRGGSTLVVPVEGMSTTDRPKLELVREFAQAVLARCFVAQT